MAKKKKKPRKRKPAQPGQAAPPQGDATAKRQERLDARRQAREDAVRARRRAELRRRLTRLAFYAAGIVVLVWFFFIRGQTPDEIQGHEILKFSEAGTAQHQSGTINYETTPPVAGPHAPAPAPCGIFNSQIPNENLVHSFEHGAVGLLYRPDTVSMEDIRTIEGIADDFESHVISAPFPGMEPNIVAASWGEKMELDRLDAPALREYTETFRQRGPESIDCDATTNQPFQGGQQPPGHQATPSPSSTGEEDGGGRRERGGRNRDRG